MPAPRRKSSSKKRASTKKRSSAQLKHQKRSKAAFQLLRSGKVSSLKAAWKKC